MPPPPAPTTPGASSCPTNRSPWSATPPGCTRCSPTCSPTPARTLPPAPPSPPAWTRARRGRWCSPSSTTAPASRPRRCRASSSGSSAASGPAPGTPAAPDWAWRSCMPSSLRTAAPCRSPAGPDGPFSSCDSRASRTPSRNVRQPRCPLQRTAAAQDRDNSGTVPPATVVVMSTPTLPLPPQHSDWSDAAGARRTGIATGLANQLVRFGAIGVASTLAYLALYVLLRGALGAQQDIQRQVGQRAGDADGAEPHQLVGQPGRDPCPAGSGGVRPVGAMRRQRECRCAHDDDCRRRNCPAVVPILCRCCALQRTPRLPDVPRRCPLQRTAAAQDRDNSGTVPPATVVVMSTPTLPLPPHRSDWSDAAGARRTGIATGLANQLVRFGAIGVASTLAYLALYVLLRGALGAQPANLLALLATAVANTTANRRLTFGLSGRAGAGRAQVEGLLVFGLGLALTSGALAALPAVTVHPGRRLELTVLVAANATATVLRFLLLRSWVFAPHRRSGVGGNQDRELQ